MNEQAINLGNARHKKARLGKKIGKGGFYLLILITILCGSLATYILFIGGKNFAALMSAPAIIGFMLASWWKRDLSVLEPHNKSITDRLSYDVLSNLPISINDNKQLFQALSNNWQSDFILGHLTISDEAVLPALDNSPEALAKTWTVASQIADQNHSESIEVGFIIASLLMQSSAVKEIIIQSGNKAEDIQDIVNWLARSLDAKENNKKYYGGIGRDWANGWTPLLNKLGQNISLSIEKYGANYGWLTDSEGVKAVESAFDNNAKAVALIGPDGIGKSSSVKALAQKLIEGKSTPNLAYHQIIGISAMDITSNAQQPGQLEALIVNLINEASKAGHIILFIDDAQTFFSDQPGAIDASQILLKVIESGQVPIILAMSDSDFQRLRTKSQNLSNLITPVKLQELDQVGVMRVLEDIALGTEINKKILITFSAIRAIYQLSDRFDQDMAYPGKAIKLLEESVPHAQNSMMTKETIEQTIEQISGVKVSKVAPEESGALLNMEDAIHKRMINQSHAVSVVSNALRRARAGVSNPNKPMGSFLFLGPTGVGKTELAKSIAAIYFGDESAMIRLDMSEYQQPDDVKRLLATGENESSSLLLNIRKKPYTVVLLDEIEKAHPNILNLLLQLLDEGRLTDESGKAASFKDSIIITTSNAGAQEIRERIEKGENIEDFANQFTDNLINAGSFKPELLNRFDEIVLFRPLNPDELKQVVGLMLEEVNKTLSNKNIKISLTDAAITQIVKEGNDPRLGARPMRRALQRAVENSVAQKILSGAIKEGDSVTLDVSDLASE